MLFIWKPRVFWVKMFCLLNDNNLPLFRLYAAKILKTCLLNLSEFLFVLAGALTTHKHTSFVSSFDYTGKIEIWDHVIMYLCERPEPEIVANLITPLFTKNVPFSFAFLSDVIDKDCFFKQG